MTAAIRRIFRRVRRLVTPRKLRLKRIHERRQKAACLRFEKLALEYLGAAAHWHEETLKLTKGKTTAEAVLASRKTAADALRACIAFYKKHSEPYQHAMEHIARTKGIHGLHKRPRAPRTLR